MGQQQFGNDGTLVLHEAKRFKLDQEMSLLNYLDWPIYAVEEEFAVKHNSWGVLNQDKDMLIVPRTEAAKRFFAKFWDGHQEDKVATRGRNPIYDPFKLSNAVGLFEAIDSQLAVRVTKDYVHFACSHFHVYLLPQKKKEKETPEKDQNTQR